MVGQKIIFVKNTKPVQVSRFVSKGMILCARNGNNELELLVPPGKCDIGEKVSIDNVAHPEHDIGHLLADLS